MLESSPPMITNALMEGYGQEIMKNYDFDSKDCMWIFSHTGINAVNIDMALEAKKRGMKVIVYGSASETGDRGVLEEECSSMLSEFFRKLREKKKQEKAALKAAQENSEREPE